MLCIAPYRTGLEEFGCGKCLPCKFAKRRVWVGRILLELQCHRHSCFVTLTYKDPVEEFSDEHVRLFLQRLRRAYGKVRYLIVGERGTRSGRRHYHCALFGVPFGSKAIIDRAWKLGFTDVGELNGGSAAYIVKYLLKDEEERFRRMSTKPGIGGTAVERLAQGLAPLLASGQIEDVPVTLRTGGRQYAVGRYVRKAVRIKCGMEGNTPGVVRERAREEYAAQDVQVRENQRLNGYQSALARLAILKSKEKLK